MHTYTHPHTHPHSLTHAIMRITQVVLNTEQKDAIVDAVTSFKQFKEYIKRRGGEDRTPEMLKFSRAARGLLLLFSGPSGTGKTLTANALAACVVHADERLLFTNRILICF